MSHVKTEIQLFLLVMRLLCHVTIVGGQPFLKAITISSLADMMASRRFRYNVFYLSRDLTWPHEQKDM